MRIASSLVALVALLTVSSVAAQSKPDAPAGQAAFPTGPRGQLAKAWLDAYNGGDAAVYRKYMEANAESGGTPIDARVERLHQMRENLGELTVLEAKEVSDGIELKVRTAKGENGVVTVMITAAAPFKFQALKVEL